MSAPSAPGAVAATGSAATAPVLHIRVFGVPAPQGSKRAFRNKHTGRIHLTESSNKVAPWREAVKWATRQAMDMPDLVLAHNAGVALFDGPVEFVVAFYLPRPKSHFRTGRNAHLMREAAPRFPAGTPDCDKLVRATCDGLGESGIWRDDAQVVHIEAWKYYADRQPPGATITVREAW